MINVIQCGLGAMGTLMASIILDKKDLNLVGAVCLRSDLHGTDISDFLNDPRAQGAKIYPDLASAIHATRAEIVLFATGSFLTEQVPLIEQAASAGLHVVSIAEEMAYPAVVDKQAAQRLDRLAKAHQVTILGTGINPGFVLDVLIIALTGICRRIDCLYAERSNDLAPYGATVMQTQGIGLTPQAFAEGVENGTVFGHIGFHQSLAMIAEALQIKLDCVQEQRDPIVAQKERRGKYITVAPGRVAGCRHTVTGFRDGKPIIELVHPQQIDPVAEAKKTWDTIKIKGLPDIDLRIEPEIPGGLGTASIAVNMAPLVFHALPGLKTMIDLPVPRLAALR